MNASDAISGFDDVRNRTKSGTMPDVSGLNGCACSTDAAAIMACTAACQPNCKPAGRRWRQHRVLRQVPEHDGDVQRDPGVFRVVVRQVQQRLQRAFRVQLFEEHAGRRRVRLRHVTRRAFDVPVGRQDGHGPGGERANRVRLVPRALVDELNAAARPEPDRPVLVERQPDDAPERMALDGGL